MFSESEKYPARNRPTNQLGFLDIEIVHSGGTLLLDPNKCALHSVYRNFPIDEPLEGVESDLSSTPAYIYRTDNIELKLNKAELERLTAHRLTVREYFFLLTHFGVFFEIHDDFYDEQTGRMLQPR